MPLPNRSATPEVPHQSNNGSQWRQAVARKWNKDLKSPYIRMPVAKRSMEPDGWQNWPELGLKLHELPLDIETSQLWDWFKDEGEIQLIDIYDVDRRNPREVTARVVFRPPPKRAFWAHGICTVQHPDRSRFPDGLSLSVTSPLESTRSDCRSSSEPSREPATRLLLHPESISFGAPIGKKGVKFIRTIHSRANDDLQLQFDARSGNFVAQFPIPASAGTWSGTREYKFTVHVSQMRAMYSSVSQHGELVALVLPLQIPPRYFWKRDDMRATLTANKKSWNPRLLWSRATNVCAEIQSPLKYPIALVNDINDPEYIDIGRLTTFRFYLRNQSEEHKLMIQQLLALLQDSNVVIENYENLHLFEEDNKSMWDHLKHHQISKSENSALALLQSTVSPDVYLPFEVHYQLEVCVSRGILSEYMIGMEFLRKLAETDTATAKHILEYLADEGRPVFDPMTVFGDPKADAYVTNTRIPQHCTLTYRAVITPTTIRFDSPNGEPSNRITRRYNHIQDRFLRVNFLEESEKESIRRYRPNNDAIYTRVMRALYQGIQVGERHYEFLAFGNSQIKECSCYFFCPTEHISCDDIRNWMGQFDHIKVVAKYAARIGQCFSSTLEIKGVQTPTVREIGDIERNGYCFTDGVGIISNFLARMIIEEMGLDVFDEPSAFQFRMGGRKGVLTVWPNASKMEVHIRKSQEKFTSNHNGLEIIRCARMATATLNRQTITILENLGVGTSVFLNLLDQQIKRFELAMSDTKVAIDVLMQYIDENGTTMIMAELLKAGFTDEGRHEPFVTSILSLWRSWSLKMLKEKTRIKVEQSAFVLGCVDETGTLRGHSVATEGSREKDPNKLPQIFLQLSDPRAYRTTRVIQGICIVGRNPSLHAGDIRVVQAVDVAELRHLKDVVVFPSTGDRPVPNMLSGGDLDGDDFFIIWDEQLIPKEWNHPPMNFTPEKPYEVADGVTVDDIRDFFVSYMKNDVLGLVATSHLAHADKSGIRSSVCLKLAEMHSNAVDFQKTGRPVEWHPRFQPAEYPHFMERRNENCYPSRKALGKLYDRTSKQDIEFRPDWDESFDQRILSRVRLDEDILQSARAIKEQYDTSVRRVLRQHNVETEFELWTGFAMSKPVNGTDYKRAEELGSAYETSKHTYRHRCYQAAGGHDPGKIGPFVAAMYTVTEQEMSTALNNFQRQAEDEDEKSIHPRRPDANSMPLISFPWLFHWILIKLALGKEYDPKKTLFAASKRRFESGFDMKHAASLRETTVTAGGSSANEGNAECTEVLPSHSGKLNDGVKEVIVDTISDSQTYAAALATAMETPLPPSPAADSFWKITSEHKLLPDGKEETSEECTSSNDQSPTHTVATGGCMSQGKWVYRVDGAAAPASSHNTSLMLELQDTHGHKDEDSHVKPAVCQRWPRAERGSVDYVGVRDVTDEPEREERSLVDQLIEMGRG